MDRPLKLVNGLLRPTGRHGQILGLYLCLWLVAFATLLAAHRVSAAVNVLPLAFMLSIWLLGVLTMLLDRPGPVRNWAAPLVLSLCAPYVALWLDWESVITWVLFGTRPAWFTLLAVNALCLGGYGVYLHRMYPRLCPKCGLRSLIPMVRLTKNEKRTARTRWCASCNEKLWRDKEGNWQKERRKTWFDEIEPAGKPAAPATHP